MPETALALPPSSALARVGAPEERQYLIGILAETLGIPSKETGRADVVAILGMAVQRTIQYGWLPGVHLHCQKFETSDSRKRRQSNPNAEPEYTYTLVDGEKAWKDSGTRWRILYGVNWTYNRKPMSREELLTHARQMGFGGELPGLAYGMWSRIILIGTDDPHDPENPIFSSGVFLGKRKVGSNWYDEDLPTQVTSRDVAIRRADKRAMMQSSLSLLPVDDMAPAARMENLTAHLRSEGAGHRDMGSYTSRPPQVVLEADGDMLWAAPETPAARLKVDPKNDVDFERETRPRREATEPAQEEPVDGAWQAVEPPVAARSERHASLRGMEIAPDAPPAGGNGRCPDCHAPDGKPHATGCPRRMAEPAAARPGAVVDARPAASSAARPGGDADARPAPEPEIADARPAASDDGGAVSAARGASLLAAGEIVSEWDAYANLLLTPDLDVPQELQTKIAHYQHLHVSSEKPITLPQYNLFRVLGKSIFGGDRDDEHKMLLSCLCGVAIDHDQRPGSKLSIVLDCLKDPNKYNEDIQVLFDIVFLCRELRKQLEE